MLMALHIYKKFEKDVIKFLVTCIVYRDGMGRGKNRVEFWIGVSKFSSDQVSDFRSKKVRVSRTCPIPDCLGPLPFYSKGRR